MINRTIVFTNTNLINDTLSILEPSTFSHEFSFKMFGKSHSLSNASTLGSPATVTVF